MKHTFKLLHIFHPNVIIKNKKKMGWGVFVCLTGGFSYSVFYFSRKHQTNIFIFLRKIKQSKVSSLNLAVSFFIPGLRKTTRLNSGINGKTWNLLASNAHTQLESFKCMQKHFTSYWCFLRKQLLRAIYKKLFFLIITRQSHKCMRESKDIW